MAISKSAFFFVTVLSLLVACNGKTTSPTQLSYVKYMAHDKGDSAMVFINKSKEIFSGSLIISHGGDNLDSGEVKGVVKGDTLIGEFHFKHYQLAWKRKPVAFLMKGDTLVMGEGLMRLTVGIPNFDPSVPIDFKGEQRLVFVKSER